MRATDFYPGFSFARVLRDLRFAIQDGCRIHATKNRKCSEPILHFVLCITDLSAPPRLQPHSLGRWALLTVRIFFFREDFRGDAAISSFVNLSFGRSRFLGRYERACSHIPMLRFGMRAPNERPLALRSVGIAKLRVWVGTIRMSMGIHVPIAALPLWATYLWLRQATQPRAPSLQNAQRRRIFGDPEAGPHIYSVVKDRCGESSPARPEARARFCAPDTSIAVDSLRVNQVLSLCCHNAVTLLSE